LPGGGASRKEIVIASRHYSGITEDIFRFSPVRANLDDLKRFHGTNERLSIEDYAGMIRFCRRLIENSAE
jgi:carboxypeptidase PM20D1